MTYTISQTEAQNIADSIAATFARTAKADKTNLAETIAAYGEVAADLDKRDRKTLREAVYSAIVADEQHAHDGVGRFVPSMTAASFRDNLAAPAVALVDMLGRTGDGSVVVGQAFEGVGDLMDSGEIPSNNFNIKKVADRVAMAIGLKVPKGADADGVADVEDVDTVTDGSETPTSLVDVTLANLPNLTDAELSSVIGLAQSLLETRNAPAPVVDRSKIYTTA